MIKGVVETLNQEYGIKEVIGIPYGYAGLADPQSYAPIMLDADKVDTIHMEGGSILGTSRGMQDVSSMVQNLVNMRINMLFTIGGDGTLKGASEIASEIKRRGLEISVIGVPKTVDNDLHLSAILSVSRLRFTNRLLSSLLPMPRRARSLTVSAS